MTDLANHDRILWLELDGAVNIRDVGGIPTADGGTTARGRLLRADNLQDLSEADLGLLVDTIGLDTVVDLRTAHEIESEGPGPLRAYEQVRHVHHSLLPEAGGDALLTRDRARDAETDADLGRMVSHYLGYVAHRPDSIVGALRAVTEAPGAALVHCAAGKDRTGVVTAFALEVAGVDRQAIAADYAATAQRIEAIIRRLRGSETYREDVERKSIDEHRPRAESMDRFLREVDVRHGGVHAYLDAHGFGADEAARLRTKLRD
ncbi:protein tyrosine/serine phosphatase [Prauserella rugosa]|uniref:Protein tyrosine/serine phosphatase n=1 Tax=Prauserella rugosa TaxID=43354 RepID=A0A660CF92_9PSEU|nr:tyrosine-protein phosphatase [Prauserella rugosa]KID30222.1 protein tyrosine/serine phosphatase [Prauserella sp. Am3]TWH19621.1 protein tyrosine/serine phosphatase [Prauserella rugosa]